MKLLFAVAVVLAILATESAEAQLQMTGVISGGSGCPQGTVNVAMAPDGSSFSVLYDRLGTQVGPGVRVGAADCRVEIKIRKPLMLGFQIESADFRGFVALDPGVAAEQRVSVAAGAIRQIRDATADFGHQRWVGPVQQPFTLTAVRPGRLDILACAPPRENISIVIKTQIRMQQARNPNGQGLLTVDSADGKVMQRYKLRYQNCARTIGSVIGGILGGIGGRPPPK